MGQQKITKLTPDQEQTLITVYNHWLTVGRSCEPLDREAAARSIAAMYESIGEPTPIFMFFSSPIMCVLAYGALRDLSQNKQLESQLRSQLGSQLGSQLWSQLGSQLESQLRSQLWSQLWSQLESQLGSQLGSQLWSQLWSQLGSQLESQLWSQLGSQLESQLRSQLGFYLAGSEWCAWEVFYDFCRRIGVNYTEQENATLDLWLDQSRSCHWWWPYKGLVLVSERHAELHLNDQGQLHRDGGPAVCYSDGWSVYALNGVRVSREIAETPAAALDPRLVTKTQNSEERREIVRKVGIERVCEALQACAVDKDGDYELLMLNLGDDRFRPYLKMRNPSIGVFHIEGVSPECRTVEQALNFRNGLTPKMIDEENGVDWIQQGDVLLFPRGETKFKSRPIQLT